MIKKDIMPFHLFNYMNNYCVINIENMKSRLVDKTTANILYKIETDPKAPLTPDTEKALRSIGLVSEGWQQKHTKRPRESVAITNMALLLTQSCNLRCIYCYGDGGSYGMGGSMDEKTALQAVDWLIDQSGEMRKINIVFFGGEPFLNFSLMKNVVGYAEERTAALDKKVGFGITTNATLLNDEKISFIKEHNFNIVISIDGPKEIQDKQRPFAGGKGSFDVILSKIKKLLEVVPETCAHAVLVDDSKASIVRNKLNEIGFRKVTIVPASASLFDEKSGKAIQTRKLNGVFKEMDLESEAWIKYIKNRDSQALKELMQSAHLWDCILSFLHNTKMRHACGAGLKLVAVSCTGDIYLCHRFVGMEDYKLGNISNGDINRTRYLDSPIDFIKECTDCFARYYCSGGCKHDNAGSCGSAFKPSADMCLIRRHETELSAAVVSMFDDSDQAFLNEYEIFPPKQCPLDF